MASPSIQDIKSTLARLMASENISVQFQNTDTASFDPKTRVLTIPNYKGDLSNAEYDLFVGHEVGHALFTPNIAPNKVDTSRPNFGGFINVVEDVRIEKAIQAKFPGLRRSFMNGYKDLMDRGFFGGHDMGKLNLADKTNMYFKAGSLVTGISFTPDEQVIVDQIDEADTFEKAVEAAKVLYDFCGRQQEEQNEEAEGGDVADEDQQNSDEHGEGQGSSNSDKNDAASGSGQGSPSNEDSDEDTDSNDADGNDGDNEEQSNSDGGKEAKRQAQDVKVTDDKDSKSGQSKPGWLGNPPKVQTQESFDEKMKEMTDSISEYDTCVNGYIPEPLAYKVGWKEVMADIKARTDDMWDMERDRHSWAKFKSANKSVVTYLAKEFELHKSADEHQRTHVARTGTLDMGKLHMYRYAEDIFRRNTVISEGKNHGVIMILDWSGSMSNQIKDTIEQVQVMAMFCRQVNIPFRIFSFNGSFDGLYNQTNSKKASFSSKDGEIEMEGNGYYSGFFKLIEYASSDMKKSQFETAMTYLTAVKRSLTSYYNRQSWGWHQLGGTPLFEAYVAAAAEVNSFRQEKNLQVVNCIFLTDGEGSVPNGVKGGKNYASAIALHDKKLKTYYRPPMNKGGRYSYHSYGEITAQYLDWFEDKCGVRPINMYITGGTAGLRNALNTYNEIYNEERDGKAFKKDGFIVREGLCGYRSVMIIGTKSLKISDDKLEVEEGVTHARLTSAFIKNQQKKVTSRILMDYVAKLVA